ncbi:histidyl-tRNA synthetase, partial [Chlamydia psittaci 84-8471/1]
LLLVVLELV